MHMQFILMVYKCLFTALHNIVIPWWKIPGCILLLCRIVKDFRTEEMHTVFFKAGQCV